MKKNMILNIENMDEFNKELNKKLNNIDSPKSDKNDSSSVKPVSGKSPPRKKTSEAQLRAAKKYYEKNKADILQRNKNYYTDNRECILTRNSNYYSINKERIIKYNIENRRNRYNNDPIFRQKMQQYHLNYYYNNKLLLQEQKEQLNILTAQ